MSSCLLLPGLACREGGAESCGPIAGVGWGGGGLAAVIPLQEQPEPQGWVWAGCSPAQAALSPASPGHPAALPGQCSSMTAIYFWRADYKKWA